ncbi:hypothetical protein TRIP_C60100 [Candidatus Zixiibacteriota bacterium]|nr:hypothetical protein TRIP_C60100 [candidate division Zixibacteria bacterium]
MILFRHLSGSLWLTGIFRVYLQGFLEQTGIGRMMVIGLILINKWGIDADSPTGQ